MTRGTGNSNSGGGVANKTRRGLLRARDWIRSEPEVELRIEDLAREAGLSKHHFVRSFRRLFGETPRAYLIEQRLDAAKTHLARGESVTEACFATGYQSLGSFSALFTRRFGLAPRDWQKRVRLVLPSPGLWRMVWVPSCFAFGPKSNFGEASQAPIHVPSARD